MKFAYSMLLDFVSTSLSADQAGDLLTMAGFELEGIDEVEGEPVLDIKVMSNRGDGLSMLGLAREVLAKDASSKPTELYVRATNRFSHSALGTQHSAPLKPNPSSVIIESADCNRFACRLFEGVKSGPSPDWIQERLRRAGQRPISLLVDLTNYVMLELGQPLHAFDYDKLSGGRIVVRQAVRGERLRTLDDQDHELNSDQLMICDAEKPVGAAGIMGGLETEVSATTVRVLLESAHFLNTSIRRTRKQLGLNTEASYRFERSVDPDGVVAAIERFSELLGNAGSEIVDEYPGRTERQPVSLRVDRAATLLGMPVADAEAKLHLERLGMQVMGHGDPFEVIPPSWRPDIVREEDLVEEIGRVHGYDRIPETMPMGHSTLGGTRGKLQRIDRLRGAAVEVGFIQTISHTLRDRHPLDTTDLRLQPRTPASPDTAYLRNSLLPSLADAAVRNGARNLHLFEIGKVFRRETDGSTLERTAMAFLTTGELIPAVRKGEIVPVADFFSLKGDVESCFAAIGHSLVLDGASEDGRLHPSRQVRVAGANAPLGVLGQIHPDLAEELRLPKQTILAELFLDFLILEPETRFHIKPVSRNPAVRRDIALLIDKRVPYSEIDRAVIAGGSEVLEKHWLFDVFEGQGIPAGSHSLGIALQLRKQGENFTDEEANLVRGKVVEALAALGGTTR